VAGRDRTRKSRTLSSGNYSCSLCQKPPSLQTTDSGICRVRRAACGRFRALSGRVRTARGSGHADIAGQLLRARPTAAMISLTVMSPDPSMSPTEQVESGVVPSAMLTSTTNSSTVTSPLPSQSPVHARRGSRRRQDRSVAAPAAGRVGVAAIVRVDTRVAAEITAVAESTRGPTLRSRALGVVQTRDPFEVPAQAHFLRPNAGNARRAIRAHVAALRLIRAADANA